MTIIFFIFAVVVLACLLLVSSILPKRAELSQFELGRRQRSGDSSIGLEVMREASYVDVISIQRTLQAVLLVAFVLLSVATFGWIIGALIGLIFSLEYGKLASFKFIREWGEVIYSEHEAELLQHVAVHQSYIRWLRSIVPASERPHLQSREELEYLVADSTGVIAEDEKKLIVASLRFDQKLVSEIMTPKSVVETVRSSEILGPLVLDDLHKTGHSRFPVTGGDIDHIVGILYVHDVLTLDTSKKHTAKVETAMSKKVFYIKEDHTLSQALAAFLRTHHHLFIVINEYRETVGILTLEDTVEALLGRRIIDEFDAHEDMRLVAERKAHSLAAVNRSTGSTDV